MGGGGGSACVESYGVGKGVEGVEGGGGGFPCGGGNVRHSKSGGGGGDVGGIGGGGGWRWGWVVYVLGVCG